MQKISERNAKKEKKEIQEGAKHMSTPRKITEQIEEQTLSPFATLSKNSRGRQREIEPCRLRTEFQRDRDRIIHSKSFRRLKHKTQVFLAPEGDHYRTRLTHTLEVAQIARTIARVLRLNEDLTEAIALGHDMGHTPFGHAGERALDSLCRGGFRHNEQSLRVVDFIDCLNLTEEVRDGILCHTGAKKPSTPEGRIVCLADKIAYINHDIDDAVRAGILRDSDLPGEYIEILGSGHSERINTMISSIAECSCGGEITMEPRIFEAMMGLRRFMFDNVYFNKTALENEKKVLMLIEKLYNLYMSRPELIGGEGQTAVVDYIAGMTDRYAISAFERYFMPKSWHI